MALATSADPELMDRLYRSVIQSERRRYARNLRGAAAEVRNNAERLDLLADELDPPQIGIELPFERVAPHMSVAIEGEWHEIVCKVDADRSLLLASAGCPSWWFQVPEGDTLTVCQEPF